MTRSIHVHISESGEVSYQKSNRDKKLEPKQGKFWCGSCDAQLVYEGQKCRNCGAVSKRTIKKETNARS